MAEVPGEEMLRTDARAWLEADAPISPLGREFLAYWHGKCPLPEAGGGFPARADIAPEEILKLLPYIFMLDVVDEGGTQDFRFRLVGTAIVEIEGEHTGRLLSEMFPDREAYRVLWQQYHDAAAGKVWVRHETLRWQGRDHLHYEVILAPLQDDAGGVTMLIGIAHAPTV
ncbi:MAG: PAS domain-containing protein [Kiloniellaceae bacterium]